MKLEQQVCSLDFAKQLKELGVKQASLWYWCFPPLNTNSELLLRGNRMMYSPGEEVAFRKSVFAEDTVWYSAFTVAELGEVFPVYGITFWSFQVPSGWKVNFKDYYISADTEADARAKMLIYLIENKLITL